MIQEEVDAEEKGNDGDLEDDVGNIFCIDEKDPDLIKTITASVQTDDGSTSTTTPTSSKDEPTKRGRKRKKALYKEGASNYKKVCADAKRRKVLNMERKAGATKNKLTKLKVGGRGGQKIKHIPQKDALTRNVLAEVTTLPVAVVTSQSSTSPPRSRRDLVTSFYPEGKFITFHSY